MTEPQALFTLAALIVIAIVLQIITLVRTKAQSDELFVSAVRDELRNERVDANANAQSARTELQRSLETINNVVLSGLRDLRDSNKQASEDTRGGAQGLRCSPGYKASRVDGFIREAGGSSCAICLCSHHRTTGRP